MKNFLSQRNNQPGWKTVKPQRKWSSAEVLDFQPLYIRSCFLKRRGPQSYTLSLHSPQTFTNKYHSRVTVSYCTTVQTHCPLIHRNTWSQTCLNVLFDRSFFRDLTRSVSSGVCVEQCLDQSKMWRQHKDVCMNHNLSLWIINEESRLKQFNTGHQENIRSVFVLYRKSYHCTED